MRIRNFLKTGLLCLCIVLPSTLFAQLNPVGMAFYTFETDHFRINYHQGIESTAKDIASIFENLYTTYRETYHLTLPAKTEIVLINDQEGNGGAYDNFNTIVLSESAFDFNLRGTHDWMLDVCAHEYAHILSITAAHKLPSNIPAIQFGYFAHPNRNYRAEIVHMMPIEVLPPWFYEGIAQYESSRNNGDDWDTHRDMILRTLTLSKKLLPYYRMSNFAGKGDDFEKTYDHGFSMVRYIAETYGFQTVVALCKESTKINRINFERSIKAVLGISSQTLYSNWQRWLEKRYTAQLSSLGLQVYGKKINKDGFHNVWPTFSPDDKKVYFISNDKADYTIARKLYSYSLIDTVPADKKIKAEASAARDFFSISPVSKHIVYTSAKSRTSELSPEKGSGRVKDIFIDTLPPDTKPTSLASLFTNKKPKQITEKLNTTYAAISNDGTRIAAAVTDRDRGYLLLTDTSGKNIRRIYPDSTNPDQSIATVYNLSWAPSGSQIAFSYIDRHNRKIALYDTLKKSVSVLCDTKGDERDVRFSKDGQWLYFSSDRSGIFNIYRYNLVNSSLEQVTNVSGGAFYPDVSNDGKKLVYSGYDENGYSIYLLDSIVVVKKFAPDSSTLAPRESFVPYQRTATLSKHRSYSLAPRKVAFVPMLYGEQAVTQDNNIFAGKTSIKGGVIVNWFDPFALTGATGNEINGYFLLDPLKILQFFSDRGLISPLVDYDLGCFIKSNLFYTPIMLSYMQRGITGADQFYNEAAQAIQILPYNVTPYAASLQIAVIGEKNDPSSRDAAAVRIFAAYNKTDVTLIEDAIVGSKLTFKYNIQNGYRLGVFAAASASNPSATDLIDPRGFAARIQYELQDQKLISDEQSFGNNGQERYNNFPFHRFSSLLNFGLETPWYAKHTLFVGAGAAAVRPLKIWDSDKTTFPYYYQPEMLLQPGYAYYERDTLNDTAAKKLVPYLKGLVAGNAVAHLSASYRFPLWPGAINRSLGVIYFNHLYGAFNVNAGAGFATLSDVSAIRDKWLLSAGAEIRLETQTFGRIPLSFQIKWDRGLDRPAPLGGDRFLFSASFDFEGTGPIDQPDGLTQQHGMMSGR